MYSQQWIWHHLSMAVKMLGPLPKHFKDILKMRKEDQEPWMTAMKEKIRSLHERKVWDLIDLPKGCQTVKWKWIYAIKFDSCKKAWFVAKGFIQVFRIDYENTFSLLWLPLFFLFSNMSSLHVLFSWLFEPCWLLPFLGTLLIPSVPESPGPF